ncbi:ATP-binding protein [Nocardia nepalensis]|uniref:ATP-binding protein n=1 Tax=Nocardia nepalensis TaxID=3375448 RepID=UPI003B675621
MSTLFVADAGVAHRQWTAKTLQMVNWGGFEGHHSIDLSAPATLISGSSGAGKSTLMDAYIALMMDSTVPFNGASNNNVTGRARGNEQRNVLSYMRGKIDTSREAGTGGLQDHVLRGRGSSTWSAVSMTWSASNGDCFTALRIYFASASASTYQDLGKHWATIDRAFDLRGLEPYAAEQFPERKINSAIPKLKFHTGYGYFASTLFTKLGIGAHGDGAKAMKLLARIQAGKQVTTVDSLYKEMVLEEPQTFSAADQAVDHFNDLDKSYDAMRNVEEQVKVLAEIQETHSTLVEARSAAALIDSTRLDELTADTPFTVWARRREFELISAEMTANRSSYEAGETAVGEARRIEKQTSDRLEDIRNQIRANGGDALDSLEQKIGARSTDLVTARRARRQFEVRTKVLGATLGTRDDHDRQRQESERFLADYESNSRTLETQRDAVVESAVPLKAQMESLTAELKSMQNRDSLVPMALHNQRVQLADALRVDWQDLPFVAELLDMAPGFDAWRSAAELALGGFALTVLVDEHRRSHLRRAMNAMKFPRRLRHEGIDLHRPLPAVRGTHTLIGRFVTKDTPFTGWLLERLLDRFDYTCVDDVADLDNVDHGLTIVGQTKDGRRGAHGGMKDPILGFSNTKRRQELAEDITDIERKLRTIAANIGGYDDRRRDLLDRRDAHKCITETSWETIDTQTIEDEIAELTEARDRLLASNDILGQLKAEEAGLEPELDGAQRDRYLAEDHLKKLDNKYADLKTREKTVLDHLDRMGTDLGPNLTDEQCALLDGEYSKTASPSNLSAFDSACSSVRRTLRLSREQASNEFTNAEKRLTSTFEHFQARWPRPNLGVAIDSYDGYREILAELLAEGIHQRRAKFSREISEWSGQDLLRLHGAFEEAIEEIESRLIPVNDILSRLPFGPRHDRLHINLRRVESKDITQFRRDLKTLASGSTALLSDDQIEPHFKRLRRFIDKIRKSDRQSQRDYFIDVRRHVYVDAERRDTEGKHLGVYTSLGGKSGGETQELVAFIVGAALRYQLGDATSTRPRYAPVFLDEGFIKSDAEFAGRAVSAWQGLGFQLIIGAPLDKVTAIEPYMDQLLQILKNSTTNHSHVAAVTPVPDPAVVS